MISDLKYYSFVLLTFTLFMLQTEIHAEEQMTKEQIEIKKLGVEIEKLQKENKLLEYQIEENSNVFVMWGKNFSAYIPVIIPVAGTAIITFLAWRRERRILPTADQEKIILDQAKQWFYHHYLDVYNKIWLEIKEYEEKNVFGKILKAEEVMKHDEFIKKKWTELCATKEFPINLFDKPDTEEVRRKKFVDSLVKKLNRKESDRKDLDHDLETIGNSSHVMYYEKVFEQLPLLIEYSINAVLEPSKKLVEINREQVRDEVLKKLRRLMIFTRLREDPIVVETLLDAKLNEYLRNEKTKPSEIK